MRLNGRQCQAKAQRRKGVQRLAKSFLAILGVFVLRVFKQPKSLVDRSTFWTPDIRFSDVGPELARGL